MAIVPPLSPPRLAEVEGPQLPSEPAPGSYGEWHDCRLGDYLLPGRWKVMSGGIRLKTVNDKKLGNDGSRPIFAGIHPGSIELEGEFYKDTERDAFAQLVPLIMPRPGNSSEAPPLNLKHAAVSLFGFAINIKVVGCSFFQHTGPCTTRVQLSLLHWMPPAAGARNVVVQPTQVVRNARADAARKQNPPNPLPTSQPGIAGPPMSFTPGTGQ